MLLNRIPAFVLRVPTPQLLLVGLVCCLFESCVAPNPQPPSPPATLNVGTYYLPLSASYKYWYLHYDYRSDGSIEDSSVYVLTYAGNAPQQTTDGPRLIHDFLSSDSNAARIDTLQVFVSDSTVVEYGSDDNSADHRIVRLADSLQINKTWTAASSYKAPDGQSVSIDAHVVQLLDELTPNKTAYQNVYQVNYRIHAPASESLGSFQDNAYHAIYYAQTFGRVLETCYDGSNRLLWEDRLINITARP